MLGKSHAKMAGVTWIGVLALGQSFGVTVNGLAVGLSTVTAVSAGIAPDIDHRQSSATRNLGIFGSAASFIVRKIAKGHRGLTHSLGGVGIATALVMMAQLHPVSLGIMLGLLVGTALDIVPKVPEGVEWLIALVVGLTAGPMASEFPIWLLPMATAWGWHMHLICDRCTIERFPYSWPLTPHSHRTAWKMFRTGSKAEIWTVRFTYLCISLMIVGLGLPVR